MFLIEASWIPDTKEITRILSTIALKSTKTYSRKKQTKLVKNPVNFTSQGANVRVKGLK